MAPHLFMPRIGIKTQIIRLTDIYATGSKYTDEWGS